MSKFNVGDRVRFVAVSPDDFATMRERIGKIAVVVAIGGRLPYSTRIRFDDGYEEHMAENQIRRLVPKRKPPAAPKPDRVMVAAKIAAGLLANPNGPVRDNPVSGWDYVNCTPQIIAQVAFDLADALIDGRMYHAIAELERENAELRAKLAAANAKLADADFNAPWLSAAHSLCADMGIPSGHILDRIAKLREMMGRKRVEGNGDG